MINSNDLRIGNLVETYYPFSISEVTHILKNSIIVSFDNDGLKQDIKPIPITENWLIKFGFKKKLNGWYDKVFLTNNDMDDKQIISINYESKRCSLSIEDATDFVYISNGIKYVHQLQNLYYTLTGEELILKA